MHKYNCSVYLILTLLSITTWLINRNGDMAFKILPKQGYPDMQTYLHNMYQREIDIFKNWSVQEVEDIRASVTGMIEEIVYRAFRNQELLHIPRDQVANHLQAMGSIYEGTKIRSPDEFDFLVRLPHFSSSNIAIMWDYANENCAKLKYLNESHKYPTGSPFRQIIRNNMLTTNIITMFQGLATPALRTMYDNKFQVVMNSGSLTILSGETKYRYVCVTFYFQWKSAANRSEQLTIKVDFVPSVYLPSRDIFKTINPITDKLSTFLGLDGKQLSPPLQEYYTIGSMNDSDQFCVQFIQTQTSIMQVLNTERLDIVECFKLVKSFNPHKSPISSMHIKSLLIYEILPITPFTKDSMSVCVFTVVVKLLKLIKSKTCKQVLFPDLFFGYTYPRRLFKCHRDKQLYNLSQTFETVYSRLKGLNLPA